MAKKSATQLAAQQAFFEENNIRVEPKRKYGGNGVDKKKKVSLTTVRANNLGLSQSMKDFAIYIRCINKAPKIINMSSLLWILLQLILIKIGQIYRYSNMANIC